MSKKRKPKQNPMATALHADTTALEQGLQDAAQAVAAFDEAISLKAETLGTQEDAEEATPVDRPTPYPALDATADGLGLQDDLPASAEAIAMPQILAPPPVPTEEAHRGGRPIGSRTQERPIAVFRPPRCPTCSSTRREAFRDGPVMDDRIPVEIDGQPYNRELWRNTRCLDCGQQYRVVEYRFEPSEECLDEDA